MPAGRKGKYNEWISPDGLILLEDYAREGYSDAQIADKIHVAADTFYHWTGRFEQIKQALKKGRVPVNAVVKKTFLEEKLKSRIVELKTTEKTIHRDPNGNITGSTEHIRLTEQFIPADTTAMIFYMKCKMGYHEKMGIELSAGKDGKLADLIKGLKEDDLYSETAAADETVADEQP